jgi:3-hydroxyacyl-[acyl-carrier-protein] dehydratase
MSWFSAPAVPYAAPLRAVQRWRLVRANESSTLIAVMPVDPNDPNLRGHFPDFPIYPGVFIVETLCQAMSAAFGQTGSRPRLCEVRSLRLTAPLHGGDELTLTATVTPHEDGWHVQAKGVRRDGLTAATVVATFDRPAVA